MGEDNLRPRKSLVFITKNRRHIRARLGVGYQSTMYEQNGVNFWWKTARDATNRWIHNQCFVIANGHRLAHSLHYLIRIGISWSRRLDEGVSWEPWNFNKRIDCWQCWAYKQLWGTSTFRRPLKNKRIYGGAQYWRPGVSRCSVAHQAQR